MSYLPPPTLLGEGIVYVHRCQHRDRLAVQQRRLVDPLLDCIGRGSSKFGGSVDYRNLRNVSLFVDGNFEPHGALNPVLLRFSRVDRCDKGDAVRLLYFTAYADEWPLLCERR